jgi:outer membrane protein TolC
MPRLRSGTGCALFGLAILTMLTGCSATTKSRLAGSSGEMPSRFVQTNRQHSVQTANSTTTGTETSSQIIPAGFEDSRQFVDTIAVSDEDLFEGRSVLELPYLVEQVRQRNPNLQAAQAAWAAAAEKYPQAVAFDDPVLQSMAAPGTFASNSSTQASYFVGISQKVPWAGKRSLKGELANAETNVARFESDDVSVRLVESTRIAFLQYYLVRRTLQLNGENQDALEQFRETAKAKFEASQVTQQDLLQADVELALQKSRLVELEQNDKIAIARINTLLHRDPNLRLPPPPETLVVDDPLLDRHSLQQLALGQRPDLQAQAARIQAEQTSVALACKEFYPDLELMGRYDQFWTDVVQRGQVGMYLNIPLNQSRRHAALRESMARVAKMQAEYISQVDAIQNDIAAGIARWEASRKTLEIFDSSILPAAESNVNAAQTGYEAGQIDFLRLIEAQRQLIGLREKQQEAIAEYHTRRAELERAIGAGSRAELP